MEKVLVYSKKEYLNEYISLFKKDNLAIDTYFVKNEKEIIKNIVDAEILFTHDSFPYHLLEKAQNLKWIQVMSAGVEKVVSYFKEAPKSTSKQVVITCVKGPFGYKISEYVIAYMLAFMQNIPRAIKQKEKKEWNYFEPEWINGKKVGIIGVGAIGSVIASKLSSLNMKVYGLDLYEKELPEVEKVYTLDQIDIFLPDLDFIILTLPVTDQTKEMINRDVLSKMKKNSILINVARGLLVKENDLLTALQEKWIKGAILDVFCEEPLPSDHPFWEMKNVLLTPHNAGPALPEEVFDVFKNNLKRFKQNKLLKNTVDLRKGF